MGHMGEAGMTLKYLCWVTSGLERVEGGLHYRIAGKNHQPWGAQASG